MSSSYLYPAESDADLGFIGLTTAGITSAISAAGGPGAILDGAKSVINSIFGGGGSYGESCATRTNQIASTIRKYLTYEDRRRLGHMSGSSEVRANFSPKRLAQHATGGHDCNLNTYVPPNIQQWITELGKLISKRQTEKEAPEQSSGSDSGSPAMAAVGGKGLAKYAIPVAIGIGTLGIGGLLLSTMNDKNQKS